MGRSDITEIELSVVRRDGGPPVSEKLSVQQIGPNHFKLVYSPGLVEGLAAGDEFELTANDPLEYKMLRQGGNVCVWFFFDKRGQNKGSEARRLREAVEKIGGRLDGGGHFSLVFTIPVSVGFPLIEHLFSEAAARILESTWMFANVYDPKDGRTPLNWWE